MPMDFRPHPARFTKLVYGKLRRQFWELGKRHAGIGSERMRACIERKAGGTEVGLSIAKDLEESHGGKIGVERELGKGCSFRFT